MKTILLSIFSFVGITVFSQVAEFNFNNGNANDAIGTNNGVVTSATLTTDRFGNVNSAYEFDGVDDIISVADASEFQFTSNYGISAWVYIEDLNGQSLGPIVIKRNPSAPYNQYALAVTGDIQMTGLGNTIQYLHKSDVVAGSQVTISEELTIGWHHVVVTSDEATNLIEMYYDNTLVESLVYSDDDDRNVVVAGKPFEIGGNADGSFFFKGKIDDVIVYKEHLSSNDVNTLFLAPDPATLITVENDLNLSVRLSPNPCHSVLTIASDVEISEIIILDAAGKIVKTETQPSFSVEELKNGIYFLTISTDQGTVQRKFIKE